jgi:hypothetical protein
VTMSWLIDDRGEYWREGALERERVFSALDSNPTMSDMLLKQAGYVRARLQGGRAVVEFERSTVAFDALVGLLRWTAEFGVQSIVFVHDDIQPATQLAPTSQIWIEYIATCLRQRRQKAPYISRSMPIVMSPFHDRIAGAHEVVRLVADPTARDCILDSLFDGAFAIARFGDDGTSLVVGSGTRQAGPENQYLVIGQPVTGGPDPAFGGWLEVHYARVLQGSVPVADDVDAMVFSGSDVHVVQRYTRAVIPVIVGSSDRLVLSVAAKRPGAV